MQTIRQGRTAVSVVLAATFLYVAWRFAWYDLFSTFHGYDDEGYMLMAAKLMLEGHVLYDEISTTYGPAYFLLKWLVHSALGVPLTHDGIRILTAVQWIFIALASGAAVLGSARSRTWAWGGTALVFLSLDTLHAEPGHPQELVAVLCALLPLVVWSGRGGAGRPAWWLAGTLCGLLLATKINVGIFCTAAVATAVLARLPASGLSDGLRWLAIALSAALPFAVMRPLLHHPDCLGLAFLCASATTGAAIAVVGRPASRDGSWIAVAGAAAGGSLGLSVAAGFALLHGSTLSGMFGRLALLPLDRLGTFVFLFPDVAPAQLALALASLALAAAVTLLPRFAKRDLVLTSAKAAFALYCIVVGLVEGAPPAVLPGFALGWVIPWAWLCVAGADPIRSSGRRQLLALVAAWLPLIAFPVAGSQIALGSFLTIAAGVVCGVDVVRALATAQAARAAAPDTRRRTRRAVEWSGLVLALLALQQVNACGKHAERRFQAGEPLALPGAETLRLPAARAAIYRAVAEEARAADVLFGATGFNSLYFWSGTPMAAPVIVSHELRAVAASDRRRIMEGLCQGERPRVVLAKPLFQPALPDVDLVRWIEAHFEPYATFGGFRMARPRGDTRLGPDACPPPATGRD